MDASPLRLQWSAQYDAKPSAHVKSLKGDKCRLPSSALDALLGAAARLHTQRTEIQPDSDFIPSFNATSPQNQLPQPLTFRLINPHNSCFVYAGVQEFSADEDTIILSEFLRTALGLDESSDEQARVTVHVEELAKGQYVRLRPLEAGYDAEDWKALLEQHLRSSYTTLSRNQILTVPHHGSSHDERTAYYFLIDAFRPDTDAICIVDTDLEVDIEALNEEQARETVEKVTARIKKSTETSNDPDRSTELSIFGEVRGSVRHGAYVDYGLSSWPRSETLYVTLESDDVADDSTDLFASPYSSLLRVRPRVSDYVFADLVGGRQKQLIIEPSNAAMQDAEVLWVAIHIHQDKQDATAPIVERAYSLRVTTTPNPDDEGSDDRASHEGDTKCQNCQRWVPSGSYALHEVSCRRRNVLCPLGCGQVLQKDSSSYTQHWHCPHDTCHGMTALSHAKHDYMFHPIEPLTCTRCSTKQTFPSRPLLAQHHVTVCAAKLTLCRFCHLEVAQEGDPDEPNAEALISGMTVHELIDGSRTTECHICSRITRLRDLDTHMKHHDFERKSRPRPRVCRNVNCGRTQDGVSGNGHVETSMQEDRFGLCSACYTPLYVSLYDPEHKALLRRIERRYLQQILTGCGKSWCRNSFCKTGQTHLATVNNSKVEAISTKDALPLIKPYVNATALSDRSSALHFCVDASAQQSRVIATVMTAESELGMGVKGGGYDFAWCIAALEAERGDADKARAWLHDYAPRRDEEKM